MQIEHQILFVVYSAFGLLGLISLAFRKLWLFIRIAEAALIFPMSYLAIYFFFRTLVFADQHQQRTVGCAEQSEAHRSR
ncbi:hypothetical protein A1353_16610 [Methylomonas methanica]|uniref:Uncharacterized protein n=1 Tax=Methylomonas methanica TaxID=421 RepID=A0A177M9N6_METMH|nr:hypothetical protein A1353_16610 [Methylomonas methanica]